MSLTRRQLLALPIAAAVAPEPKVLFLRRNGKSRLIAEMAEAGAFDGCYISFRPIDPGEVRRIFRRR